MISKPSAAKFFLFAILLAGLALPALLSAQPLFTFAVNDLEAYNRTGNWIYDADGPTFPTHDGNWFSFSPSSTYQFHYFAEKYIRQGTPTTLVCTQENVPLADNPGQIGISFTQFNLVAIKRINTVDPLAPWDTPGQSGDERVYANSYGYITYNGTPVLKLSNATFVITTPYPNQAQIRALSPLLYNWTGDIGTGAPQTGYGFGDLDLNECDPAWAALFASSDYKVQLNMVGITSTVTQTAGYFDFALEILPAPVPSEADNEYLVIASLPENVDFPSISVGVEVLDAVAGGQNNDMQHIWLREMLTAPAGALPPGLDVTANKYWQLGTTLNSFLVNLRFSLDNADFGKGPADWRILYRYSSLHPWSEWQNYDLLSQGMIRANNVNVIGEFTVAMPEDQPTPVVLSGFTAVANASNQATVTWSTASETELLGFRVWSAETPQLADAVSLTPVLIPAQNVCTGACYSYTATELDAPGTYWFWLESLDINGTNQFHGPVSLTLSQGETPSLPDRTQLGQAYPNPFNTGQSASIGVEVKAGDSGFLSIYNLAGRKVASYPVQQGQHTIVWNGLDLQGRPCASGVYLYRLETATHRAVRRMVVLK